MAVLFLCSDCRKSLSFRGRSAPVGIRLPAPTGAELPLPPSAREVSKSNVLTEGETGGCGHPPLRTVSRRFFRRRRCPRSEASTLGVHRPARCTNAFPLLPRRGGRLCPPLHPSIGGKALFKTQRRVRRIALPPRCFFCLNSSYCQRYWQHRSAPRCDPASRRPSLPPPSSSPPARRCPPPAWP